MKFFYWMKCYGDFILSEASDVKVTLCFDGLSVFFCYIQRIGSHNFKKNIQNIGRKMERSQNWILQTMNGRFLMFTGPCIVIYSYSKTNQMHLFLKIFILAKHSTCFRQSFRPSSGAQDCTYSNRHTSNNCCYLPLVATRWQCNSISFPLAAGSSSFLTYAFCCMCSLELLMMDGKTA
jgi:hypothetical protein